MEAPFGHFGGTTVPSDYDTVNKKLTGNLNGHLLLMFVCLNFTISSNFSLIIFSFSVVFKN